MKLALGTAQFGLNYGIANSTGQTPRDETCRIIQSAWEFGLDTLDTASAYGESEQVLGEIGVSGWNIVSKVPPFKNGGTEGRRWVLDHVQRSLAKLGVKQLGGLLLHDASDLLDSEGLRIKAGLAEAKAEGFVAKIGYSIYGPEQLTRLLDVLPPDLIQAPLNIFDQRLVNTGWLNRLMNAGVEVHTRSVFLQGLLLMPPQMRPASFNVWHKLWEQWDKLAQERGESRLDLCMGFVRQHSGVSRVVVGVDNLQHFNQLVEAWKTDLAVDCTALACSNPLLVEPVNWKK